jgi:hypothetical protein
MFQSPATFRVVVACLSFVIGTTLMLAKVYFGGEFARRAAREAAVVLPVAEVVGKRPATDLAAAPASALNPPRETPARAGS